MGDAKVWKYELPLRDQFEIEMPYRGNVRRVLVEGSVAYAGTAYVYVQADPQEKKLPVRFRLLRTDEVFSDCEGYSYVDTFQVLCDRLMEGPPRVYHLFVEHPAATWNRAHMKGSPT